MENYPIDFVIIWVDGNDTKWQKEKARYSEALGKEVDDRACRYREWDNLQYWFRGVEKFAPWVNKVYFVTCGHVPAWLNQSAEKLCLVKHSDYIPAEYLPTFSSHPIELNLHRINGLQEHFVYFNDDMFITRPVTPELFFQKGLPVHYARLRYLRPVSNYAMPHIHLNNLSLINRIFTLPPKNSKAWLSTKNGGIKEIISNLFMLRNDIYYGFEDPHLPVPILRSTIEKLWDVEGAVLSETSSHKFRDYHDVNQYIFRYWQLVSGQFVPIKKRNKGKYYNMSVSARAACTAIEKQTYPMICINDIDDSCTGEAFEEMKQSVKDSFCKILPDKSSFEI